MDGAGFFVLQGRGLGLLAHVVRHQGDSLELDRDISGLIDEKSVVSITSMQENFLVIGNSFTDTGPAQIFGTGYKHVFAENSTERSSGLVATALNYYQAQPNFYIQFLDNKIASVPLVRSSAIDATGRQFEGNTTLLTLGIVIRGNQLQSGSSIIVDGRSRQFPAVRNVLIEDNQVEYNDIGVNIGLGVEDLILRNNKFKNVQTPIKRLSSQ
ncbi:hypothetical protein KX729_02990 [Rhizobium sp. XQZ8]|uniref:hypothetical protein n=1 Tax=Rhizobium populisoli TaxID=2859785 RepID=UPI001CA5B05A|nr:hypothetical protein [Rhizobium populisoli]MBW6420393.1 hypothetical protein [Rhizobium populisoli]